MILAYLCDFDGTLVDTYESNFKAYFSALSSYGVKFDSDKLANYVGKVDWRSLFEVVIPHEDEIYLDLIARKRILYKDYMDEIRVNIPLIEMLESQYGKKKIAIVSSASYSSIEAVMKNKNIPNIFDLIVSSDLDIEPKPSPRPYFYAAEMLNVCPDQCLVFEDSDVGLISANRFCNNIMAIKKF